MRSAAGSVRSVDGERASRPIRRRDAFRGAVLACGLALAGGCVSVPLSTLWKMRDFGPQELLQLDPAALRVAATTAEGVQPDPAKTRLRIGIVEKDGAKRVLDLALEEAKHETPPDAALAWTILKTDAASSKILLDLRDALRAHPEAMPKGASIDVDVFMKDRPAAEVKTLHLYVSLRLGADQAWMPLFDGVAIPVGIKQTL